MPRHTNLGTLSLDELVALRDEVAKAIEGKVAEEQAELQKRLDALSGYAVEAGSSPAKRGRPAGRSGARGGRRASHPLKGTKVPVKYRGPNGETWSGRGLAPRWLTDLEAKGKKRETYLVS
jgi:DNA-binding protein H-NS